jgi:hypothetical protein
MSVRGAQGCEAYGVQSRVALVRVPFYFINLLPTSLLYISILLIKSPKVTVNTKKHHEEGTSQELEAGGNGEMCQHAQLILTWSAGYIMTPS